MIMGLMQNVIQQVVVEGEYCVITLISLISDSDY